MRQSSELPVVELLLLQSINFPQEKIALNLIKVERKLLEPFTEMNSRKNEMSL